MNPPQKASEVKHLLRWILLILLFLFSLCICWVFFTFFGNDVFGTIKEFFARYPGSESIWVGYGAYGSSDYGDKMYIRWTSDDAAIVRQYYGDNSDVDIVPVTENYEENLWVCVWAGYFAERENSGCNVVKKKALKYGTVIIYRHDFFSG